MKKTIKELHAELVSQKRSISALIEECRREIESRDGELHATLGFYSDSSIKEQIKNAEQMFKDGSATILTGIPFVIKDNILVKGEHATAGSKMLEKYVSPYDAYVIRALKGAGAILLARGNMDEFAMGSSTENSAFGPTKNPVDTTRVAGGSSGGSAASVAAGYVPAALGSDTGGSIRQPASFCGVVGLKTTYGMTSRYGAVAMGSSLDQIGPMAHTVEDVESIYHVISQHDANDSTSLTNDLRVPKKTKVKKIGVPWSFVRKEGVDKEVLANFEESVEKLKGVGYEITDIEIPHLDKALSVYYILMFAEVSSNLARYDGVRYGLSKPGLTSAEGYVASRTSGLGDEVRRRVLIGTYVLSSGYYDAYYAKAQSLRAQLKESFVEVFNSVDCIIMPTSPVPAFKLNEKAHDPLSMYLADIFTVPISIVGAPAISVPSGKTKDGLPLGIQFIAPHCGEESLFTIGKDFEKLY